MFAIEQKNIEEEILAYFSRNKLPIPTEISWQPIPFLGEWGISVPLFPVAAQEARAGKKVKVPQRAQEIASELVDALGTPPGFNRVEAVRGYLNLYFEAAEFSRRVVQSVLVRGDNFGRGEPKKQQVMVEYSQPNTHKSFHVGHLRSAILGDSLSRILDFAGFDVVRANYPGDIGLPVIK